MKRLWAVVVLLLVALSLIASTTSCGLMVSSTKHFREQTVADTYGQIQDNASNPKFVILDVRTPSEYGEGHIQNAINIDFYAPTFREDISKLNRNNTYLVYCRTGNRSKQAIDVMKELIFKDVYHMFEGIVGWTNSGYPTVK